MGDKLADHVADHAAAAQDHAAAVADHAAKAHAAVADHASKATGHASAAASRVLESAATLVYGDEDKFDPSKSFTQPNPDHFGDGFEHNTYLTAKKDPPVRWSKRVIKKSFSFPRCCPPCNISTLLPLPTTASHNRNFYTFLKFMSYTRQTMFPNFSPTKFRLNTRKRSRLSTAVLRSRAFCRSWMRPS